MSHPAQEIMIQALWQMWAVAAVITAGMLPPARAATTDVQDTTTETELPNRNEAGLSEGLEHTEHILHANSFVLSQNVTWEDDWNHRVNQYFKHFEVAAFKLSDGPGYLLGRLGPLESIVVIEYGPLVSVIMVSYNANDTVTYASASILNQTWRPLELIIVDDCSTDSTWQVLMGIAASDKRVRLLRNKVRVGPYVSKNTALGIARGEYITGQDADDWAHPHRLHVQVKDLMDSQGTARANMIRMLRVQDNGYITPCDRSPFCPDGFVRQAFISVMYETKFLKTILGNWDSVWYGADFELIERAKRVAGQVLHELGFVGILMRDRPGSLGKEGYNSPIPSVLTSGAAGGEASNRQQYYEAFSKWHKLNVTSLEHAFVDFPSPRRPFRAPGNMEVDIDLVHTNQHTHMADIISYSKFIGKTFYEGRLRAVSCFSPLRAPLGCSTIFQEHKALSALAIGLVVMTFVRWYRCFPRCRGLRHPRNFSRIVSWKVS